MGEIPAVPLQVLKNHRDVKKDIRDCDLFLFRGYYRSSKLFEKMDFSYYSHAQLGVNRCPWLATPTRTQA